MPPTYESIVARVEEHHIAYYQRKIDTLKDALLRAPVSRRKDIKDSISEAEEYRDSFKAWLVAFIQQNAPVTPPAVPPYEPAPRATE